MQKQIFSTIVIVASFFGSLVWAEDKIMLCSGDKNYGSHSSLGSGPINFVEAFKLV